MDNNAPQSLLTGVAYALVASLIVAFSSIDLSRQIGRLYAFFSLIIGLSAVLALHAAGAVPLTYIWPTLWTLIGAFVSTVLRISVRSTL